MEKLHLRGLCLGLVATQSLGWNVNINSLFFLKIIKVEGDLVASRTALRDRGRQIDARRAIKGNDWPFANELQQRITNFFDNWLFDRGIAACNFHAKCFTQLGGKIAHHPPVTRDALADDYPGAT